MARVVVRRTNLASSLEHAAGKLKIGTESLLECEAGRKRPSVGQLNGHIPDLRRGPPVRPRQGAGLPVAVEPLKIKLSDDDVYDLIAFLASR